MSKHEFFILGVRVGPRCQPITLSQTCSDLFFAYLPTCGRLLVRVRCSRFSFCREVKLHNDSVFPLRYATAPFGPRPPSNVNHVEVRFRVMRRALVLVEVFDGTLSTHLCKRTWELPQNVLKTRYFEG